MREPAMGPPPPAQFASPSPRVAARCTRPSRSHWREFSPRLASWTRAGGLAIGPLVGAIGP
eukprot:7476862-Lingulodinium_polyedra.AAC.1